MLPVLPLQHGHRVLGVCLQSIVLIGEGRLSVGYTCRIFLLLIFCSSYTYWLKIPSYECTQKIFPDFLRTLFCSSYTFCLKILSYLCTQTIFYLIIKSTTKIIKDIQRYSRLLSRNHLLLFFSEWYIYIDLIGIGTWPINGEWYEIVWPTVLLVGIPCRISFNKLLIILNEKCFRICNPSLSLYCVSNSALLPSGGQHCFWFVDQTGMLYRNLLINFEHGFLHKFLHKFVLNSPGMNNLRLNKLQINNLYRWVVWWIPSFKFEREGFFIVS